MRTLIRAVLFVAVLSGSVLVHEYGHLLAMQASGVRVIRFTVGFGPTLWSHLRDDGVEFAVKPILLGGYTEPVAEGPGSMEGASRVARLVISLAGTFVNAGVAFVLLLLLVRLGWVEPSARMKARLERVPPGARWFTAAAAMSFGAWLMGPFRIAADYVRNVFGRHDRSRERRWQFEKRPGFAGQLSSLLILAAAINVALAEFNMLPFRPLDGGAAAAELVGAFLGPAAQDWYDGRSFLILLGFVFLSLVIGLFRPRRQE